MIPKQNQKVNDKCACGSGKKYKKCCNSPVANPTSMNTDANKNTESLHTHKYLPPKTKIQSAIRDELGRLMADIKEPHCRVCGDTANDGKLFEIPTQIGNIYLCGECYNIQKKM